MPRPAMEPNARCVRPKDMTGHRRRYAAAAFALAAGLAMAGCTSSKTTAISTVPAGSMSLVAFHSCDDALAGLRNAAGRRGRTVWASA